MDDLRGLLPVRAGYNQDNPYPLRPLAPVVSVTLHYTAGPAKQTWFDIASYQVGPTAQDDFPGIAYHLGVDGDGDPAILQSLDRRVWHSGALGANETSVGIVYTGLSQPSDKQIAGLRVAIKYAKDQLSRDLILYGHKDKYATQCPGPFWPEWKSKLV